MTPWWSQKISKKHDRWKLQMVWVICFWSFEVKKNHGFKNRDHEEGPQIPFHAALLWIKFNLDRKNCSLVALGCKKTLVWKGCGSYPKLWSAIGPFGEKTQWNVQCIMSLGGFIKPMVVSYGHLGMASFGIGYVDQWTMSSALGTYWRIDLHLGIHFDVWSAHRGVGLSVLFS